MSRVSVLSSTYNHEKYVVEAIDSVLQQSFGDFELIICDDASTDQTVDRIKSIKDSRLRLIINDENIGNTATSARCWAQCSGEYIAWLPTDDVYEPHMLKTLVDFLDSHAECEGVFGLADYIDEEGQSTGQTWTAGGVGLDRYQLLHSLFYPENFFCAPAAMIRKSFLERVGYFPPQLMQLNDMEHWVRLLFHGELKIINEKIVKYRIRDNFANVSAPKPEVSYRLAFELFEILFLFSENITTFDLLEKIFPEVRERKFDRDDRLTQYYLAQLALEFGHPSWHLFGLHLIYHLLSNAEEARYIKQKCNFSYVDLFRLEAEKHPIDVLLPKAYVETVEELNKVRVELFNLQNASVSSADNSDTSFATGHTAGHTARLPNECLPGTTAIRFGDAVSLSGLFYWVSPIGIQFMAQWQPLEHPELAAFVGVHIIDEKGTILNQADHPLPAGEISKSIWNDCFFVRNEQLNGAHALGIAVYDDPEQTLLIEGGNCDWGNHRLLVALPMPLNNKFQSMTNS
jgi:glycosyltransferase involved in cell wall biosynthesis